MAEPRVGRPHMPGYGVPDRTDGALSWTWAEERISDCRTYLVATTRPDTRPHAMPVWGVWTDGRFVFSTAITSVKSENLKANPNVVVTAQRDLDAVVLEGEARLTELDDVPGFVATYKDKYDETIDSGPVWSVVPSRAFGFIEDESFGRTATKWTWPP